MFGTLNHQKQRQPHRLALVLLCLAMLFVQTLGQLHRVAHAPALGAQGALAAHTSEYSNQALSSPTPLHSEPGFFGLFKDHQDLPKCQLFDGLGSAVALSSAISSAQFPAQGLIVSSFYNVFVVERLSHLFQARAPPFA
jgi:hypothetical protein